MAVIFALSSLPTTPGMPGGTDKVLHGLLYAGLGSLMMRAFAKGARENLTPASAVYSVLASTIYALSDEFHQGFVPKRQSDAADVLADFVGAAVASGLLVVWARLRRTRDSRPV
jgi:VanZ family protein